MNAIDLLKGNVAGLPRERTNDDFVAFLNSMFDAFLAEVAKLNARDCVSQAIFAEKSNIKDLCGSIIKAVESSLNGLPHEAYNNLIKGISTVQAHFNQLLTPQNVSVIAPLQQLYRIRVAGPEGAGFTRPDLFHIPFEKRHLVTRQRYSLPGLPCLYLGGTLYMCWQELGRPNFDSVYYARFKTAQNASIKFLDFAYRPAMIAAMINRNKSGMNLNAPWVPLAIAQAVCWPLLAACSVRRMHGNAPFIHEYIVPQLVLQWIVKQDEIDGVRYFSVNENAHVNNPFREDSTALIMLPQRSLIFDFSANIA